MKITSSEPRNTPKVARPLGLRVKVPPLQLPCSHGRFAPAAAGPAPPTAVHVLPRVALLRLTVSVAAPSLLFPGGERTSVRRPETRIPAPFTAVSHALRLPVKAKARLLFAIVVQLSAALVMKVLPL